MVAEKKKIAVTKTSSPLQEFLCENCCHHLQSSCKENTQKNPLNSKIDISLQVISQNPDHIHPKNLFVHGD